MKELGRKPWIDAWSRWERQETNENENAVEAEEDPLPPAPETFVLSFETNHHVTLEGFAMDSEAIWNSTGLTVWPAAQVLGNFMAAHPNFLDCSTVLELGSGLGPCGILAYQILKDQTKGPAVSRNIYLTDGDTDTLQQLERNVRRNNICRRNDEDDQIENSTSDQEGGVHLSCHQLLWDQESAHKFLENQGMKEGIDVLIGSDLLYVGHIMIPLFETARTLLAEKGVFYMSHCHRREGSTVSIDGMLQAASATGLRYKELVVDGKIKEDTDPVSLFEFFLG